MGLENDGCQDSAFENFFIQVLRGPLTRMLLFIYNCRPLYFFLTPIKNDQGYHLGTRHFVNSCNRRKSNQLKQGPSATEIGIDQTLIIVLK